MWICSSFGILMPAIRPPKTVRPGDLRTMQIRARRARDLDTLRAQYMRGKLGPTIHTPDKDYEYRAYCTPEAFAFAVAAMTMEIDYLKFKPTTDRYEDDELHAVYNRMWSVVMAGLSTPRHRREYWHSRPPASGKTGVTLDKTTSGVNTGWPADYASYEGYDSHRYALPAGTADYRSTAADRDRYEPEVWDAVDGWRDQQPLSTGDPELDKLYDDIEALERALADTSPMDHRGCEHGLSDNARARCRRRQRSNQAADLSELRKRLDAHYDALGNRLLQADVAESSEPVTVVEGSATPND